MRYGSSKFRTVRYIYRRYNYRYDIPNMNYYRLPLYRSGNSNHLRVYHNMMNKKYTTALKLFKITTSGNPNPI